MAGGHHYTVGAHGYVVEIVGSAPHVGGVRLSASKREWEAQFDRQWFLALAEYAQTRAAAAAAARLAPQPPSIEKSTFITELERLAALHQQGALSDAEFEQAKKKLLG